MRIQTLSTDYEVIQILRRDARKDILLAKTADLSKAEKYMFVIIKQKSDIRLFVSFCADLKQNRSFDDFLDFFPKNDQLYMLYKYYDYDTIGEHVFSEDVALKERLSILRNLIQKMVFLNAPVYLQYEALDWRNIRLDDSGMVYFNYHLYDVEKFEKISLQDVWERMHTVFVRIFARELEDKSCPSLEALIEQIRTGKLKNYMDLLQSYEGVYKKLLELDEKKEIKSYKIEFQIWDWIKSKFRYVKYILTLLVMGVLLWYLADMILHPQYAEKDVFNYKSIGTLEIQEQIEQTEE